MERRAFLVLGEIPRRVWGALRGDPVTLRRILGGRRAGRIGTCLWLAGLVCAFPSWSLGIGAVAHLVGVALFRGWPADAPPLSYSDRLRLSLWTTGPVLIACLALRGFWPGSPGPGLAGIIAGQLLLMNGLRKGLGSTPEGASSDP